MSSPRWLQGLHNIGLEFWLPLPCLGILFWSGGNLMAEHVLSLPYGTVNKLQANTQLEVKLALPVLIINAEVDKTKGVTNVEVKTTDSTLKKLEYEFPVTEISQVEATIAQELGMSVENVRKLVRYQVKD